MQKMLYITQRNCIGIALVQEVAPPQCNYRSGGMTVQPLGPDRVTCIGPIPEKGTLSSWQEDFQSYATES